MDRKKDALPPAEKRGWMKKTARGGKAGEGGLSMSLYTSALHIIKVIQTNRNSFTICQRTVWIMAK